MRRLRALAALIPACLWVLAPLLGAPAHADSVNGSYVTAVSGLTPAVAGVTVTGASNGESLTVENSTATPLYILGYDQEQTYKITSSGIYYNKISPSYKLNQEATIGNLGGTKFDPSTPPVWVKINGSDILQWHDHRIHWMGSTAPPSVASDPGHEHLITKWKVPYLYGEPGSARATKGDILGTLSYQPGSHWGSYLIWIVVGLAIVATIVVQVVLRPRRRTATAATTAATTAAPGAENTASGGSSGAAPASPDAVDVTRE